MPHRWFLSYHSPEHPLALRIKSAIERKDPGSRVFFAPADLRSGGFWSAQLAQEIADATAFILLVGGHGVGNWQVLEYSEALDKRVKNPEFPLILMLLEGQSAPGLPFLRQLHWIVTADPASERDIARLFDGASGGSARPGELWRHTSPYRGLFAMTESDADFFFGRGPEVKEIIHALEVEPDKLPVLLGNSGVGKSSLAQAGVMAALKRQAWSESAAVEAENLPSPSVFSESRRWCFLKLTPGAAPLRALVGSFLDVWQFGATDPERVKHQSGWIDLLASGKAALRDLIDATHRRYCEELGRPEPPAFLLYVDQGEELYARRNEPDERRLFSEVLSEGLGDRRLRAFMSMRSDFFGELQKDQPLYAAHRQINVAPLRETELRAVVSRPAELLGARFETDGLAGDIAQRTAEESTRDAGALPLLSYLLDDMWTQMTHRGDGVLRLPAQSVELGRVLVERANAFLANHPASEDDLRRIFTLKLATVREDAEPTRRRAARSEFSEAEWRLVGELANHPNRLLVTATSATGETTAEVAHEAIFRRWDKLRGWIASEREFLAWRTSLEAQRRTWERVSEDSKQEALLMGLSLAHARGWLAERAEDLSHADRVFVEQSVERELLERNQRRRFQRRIQQIGAAALIAMTILAVGAGVSFFRAETATKTATRIQAKYDILKAAITSTEAKLKIPAYANLTATAVVADLTGTYRTLDGVGFDLLLRLGVHAKRIVWFDPAPQNNINEAEAFRKMGFDVEQVTTIDEVVARTAHQKVDLVLTHFGSRPGGKTQSNAYRLRSTLADKGYGDLPMIIYSISVTDAYACDAQNDGFYDEVDKPAQLLQSAVRSVEGEARVSRCRPQAGLPARLSGRNGAVLR